MDVPKYVSGSGLQEGANCAACLCIMVKLLEGKMWGDHQFCQRQVGETWGYLHWILRLGTGPGIRCELSFLENEGPPQCHHQLLPQLFLSLPDRAHNLINSSTTCGNNSLCWSTLQPSSFISGQGKLASGGKEVSLKSGCPMRTSDREFCSFPNELCFLFSFFF